METKKRIGIQIRELRKAKGLTQDELAGMIDRSTEALSNLERGVDTLERLSDKLGVQLKDFFAHQQLKVTARRAELVARLMATATALSDKQLSLAVAQIEAIRQQG
jgi:transcriptional regulator with XRE-family HTH domain